MDMEVEKAKNIPKKRLQFIDMARSLAILMMLEGHFTGAALAPEFRKTEYLAYSIWHNIHGLTSPLFFTVTGVIFVFLLSANNTIPYFQNERVTKGYKRVLELLFWGYFIQLSIWSILKSIYYQSEFHLDWFYAFHVLQSIAVGIFFLLIIYGIFKLFSFGKLYWYYLFSALLIYIGYAYMKNHIQLDEEAIEKGIRSTRIFIPENAPKFIQNMFYGQYSDFSFLRYAGYTVLGGMLGSIIRTYQEKTKTWWFGTLFIVLGICLSVFVQICFHQLDNFTEWIGLTNKGVYELNATAFVRFGQVVSVLGIFMLVDAYVTVKPNLYLKMGQNTLPIYIVHVIVLYGGVLGIGLKPYVFDENLNPYLSAAISASAIVAFALMVRYIESLELIYEKCIRVFTFKRKK